MFKKATKAQSFARIALYGPSGSGKTAGSLRIASGLGGRIAVIDSERGSASKCVNHPDFQVEFDVCELDALGIECYTGAIYDAAKAGYPNLIIDSSSHAWRQLLQDVDQLSNSNYGGNKWAAWSEGTPRQISFIDAILRYPGHVIVTMRAKTEWTLSQNERGKMKPKRIGLAPDQGKGIEYEFDLLIALSTDHSAYVEKDRTGKFQDKRIELIDETFGRELSEWLAIGEPVQLATDLQKREFESLIEALKLTDDQVSRALHARGVSFFGQLAEDEANQALVAMRQKINPEGKRDETETRPS